MALATSVHDLRTLIRSCHPLIVIETVEEERVLALLLTVLALWSVVYYDNGIPGTWWFQSVLSALCLGLSVKWQYRLFKLR